MIWYFHLLMTLSGGLVENINPKGVKGAIFFVILFG